MKRMLAAAGVAVLMTGTGWATDLSGAGATFPYPIYAKWAEAYKAQSGIGLNYQSIGSGGGIKQIKAKTVDFGASDMPLKPEELRVAGLTQFPMVMGGVVPVVNLKGIKPGEINLTGTVLAEIYLGKITKWNDPAITRLNPGVALPDQAIAVVHRSDGSGTTFIFTNYLSKVSPEWGKVGASTAVDWPVGLGGKGNEGVAALVGQTDGAIGYVEYAYTVQNKLIFTRLTNSAGTPVAPESKSFIAAAANADWAHASDFYLLLTDQPGADSWPITGATFILLHKVQDKPESANAVLKFFEWDYKNGAKLAQSLDYIPMPDSVSSLVMAKWHDIKDATGKPVW
ncbi:MAG: phosphate ABC transporter substrate-binding protein PstS [Alphaproteobacteria bacterium]|nr:phosphate ABC transporter substrate-binding protein PstS [Alphaproteobacteria bacterium]